MAQKRSFKEAMIEVLAEDLGAVGGFKDLQDEIKILKGNLADAEALIKKLRLMIARKDAKIYTLETEVELLRRAMPESDDEMCSCEGQWPVICIDEESTAGDAM